MPSTLVGGCCRYVIKPVGGPNPVTGNPKLGWLKKLKNWKPMRNEAPSQREIFVLFMIAKSVLK